MKKERLNTLGIVSLFHESLKKHGSDRVAQKLKELELDFQAEKSHKIYEYILSLCSNHYHVPVQDLLDTSKKGWAAQARNMAYLLIHGNIDYNQNKIAVLFDTDRQSVNRAINQFHTGKKQINNTDMLNFTKDYEVLNEKVKEYIQSNELYSKTEGKE